MRNTPRHAQDSDQSRTHRVDRPNSREIASAAELVADGGVLAIKGLGGFHLACDATDDEAVARLRERKAREAKPLAVMVPDLSTARAICDVSEAEARELMGPAAPIVLLRRRPEANVPVELRIADGVAPGNAELGVMIAYTPIHHLLFHAGAPHALVMTSGNLSGEPICFRDEEASAKLGGIADAILGHDRPIVAPCDDSVIRVIGEQVHPLRRSRGYAPLPVLLPQAAGLPPVLAIGGELKATACLAEGERAYLSQHLGDMESLAGQQALAQAAEHLAALYDIDPAAWACDLHPDYHSTRWAQRNRGDRPLIQVQHHHAHAVSLLAEHGAIGREALVFSFDGTGYGADGAIWGGEVLRIGADPSEFTRVGHLREVRLPGGDAAIAAPWRIALAHLAAAGIDWDEDLPSVQAAGTDAGRLRQLLASDRATTPCTSIGRLFDAVSSLLGICHEARYEGQAAIELEQSARPCDVAALSDVAAPSGARHAGTPAQNAVTSVGADGVLDPGPMLRSLADGLRDGTPTAELAYLFHVWIAEAVAAWAGRERAATGTGLIGLTGGVFANALLTRLCAERLPGFALLTHTHVPAGDGGLALGQAVIAAHQLAREPTLTAGSPGRNN